MSGSDAPDSFRSAAFDFAPKKLRVLNPAKLFEHLSPYREGRAVSSLRARAQALRR